MKPTQMITPAPCKTCPFRKSPPFRLAPERRQEIAQALLDDRTFHCHEHVDYDTEDEEEPEPAGAPMCAGTAKSLMLVGGSINWMRWAERVGSGFSLDDLEQRGAEVWDLSTWQRLPENPADFDPDDEPELAVCVVSEAGCLAPAGYLGVGGGVIEGTEEADGECSVCGEPVCSECSDDEGRCDGCADDLA